MAGAASLPDHQDLPLVEAMLATQPLRIMVARTDAEKRQGLMFFTDLPADQGMLFVYDTPQQMSFWMKNTYIPLDLVFFDEDLRVTEMIRGMVPGNGVPDHLLPHYRSSRAAQYALELASGSIAAFGIEPGDTLAIPLTHLFAR